MRFTKYQGAGNDFIIFDYRDIQGISYSNLAKKVCNRKFGIGADGILIAEKSEIGDIKMLYYNCDGSRGEMCGNGIRCFSKFIYDNKLINKTSFEIETLDGVKIIGLDFKEKTLENFIVDMGEPNFRASDIPVIWEKAYILNESILIDDIEYKFSALRMGVPHAVIFIENIQAINIDYLGEKIGKHKLFPEGSNVNFIEIENRRKINIFTWERGVGKTLGCGTGACSGVVVGERLGLLEPKVSVHSEGGSLEVEILNGRVIMSGGASLIASGEYNYSYEEESEDE